METMKNNKKWFLVAVVLLVVSLVFILSSRPAYAIEINPDVVQVGEISGYQNTTSIGSVSSDSFDLTEVSSLRISYTSTTMEHVLMYNFQTTDDSDAPIYLVKIFDNAGYRGIYKYMIVLSFRPFEVVCTDTGATGVTFYDRTTASGTAPNFKDSAGNPVYTAVLDFPGNDPNEYFINSSMWWEYHGMVYDYLSGVALDISDTNYSGSGSGYSQGLYNVVKTLDLSSLAVVQPPIEPPTGGSLNTDLGVISGYKEQYRILASDDFPSNTYSPLVDPCLNRNLWNAKRSTSGYAYRKDTYIQVQMNFRFEYAKYFMFGMTEYESGWTDYKMVLASSGGIEFTNQDLLTLFPAGAELLREKGGSNWGTDYRYRICQKTSEGWQYGNWFNSSRDSVGDSHTMSITDENGNLVNDNSEYVNGQFTDLDIGQGDTLEEADDNAKPVEGSSGGGFVVSDLDVSEFLNQIGQIPSIIADVFSFLPAWCLWFVAAGFSLFVTLMIIKAVRG